MLIGFQSCVKNVNDSFNPYDRPEDSTIIAIPIEIPFDLEKDKFSEAVRFCYSDIFSNVDYIKLSDTQDISLGSIDKFEVLKDESIVVLDRTNGCICRFDSVGHFLNQIGQRGHAGDEYITAEDFQYDYFNEEIVINDRNSGALKIYDLDGRYKRSLTLGLYFSSFGVISKDYYVVNMDYSESPEEGETSYNLKIIDRNGDVVKELVPYTSSEHQNFVWEEMFKNSNGVLICNDYCSSLLFTFIGLETKPMYYLDFEENMIPNKIRSSREANIGKKVICRKFYETDSYFILLLEQKSMLLTCIIDKQNLSKSFIKLKGYNDVKGIVGRQLFSYVHNNKIYYIFDPYEIQGFLDNIDNERAKIERRNGNVTPQDIELLKDLSKNVNPIIQICTMK